MLTKAVSYLRDINLARKVVVFITLILIAFAFIVQQYHHSLSLMDEVYRENQRIRSIGNLIQNVETGVIASRRPEKEFLLRGSLTSVSEHDSLLRDVYANLDLLEPQLKLEQQELVRSLRGSLDGYIRNFSVLVSLKIRLGLVNTKGLIGKLRTAVTEVEREIKNKDDLDLLYRIEVMRGDERDYLLFKEEKFYRSMERGSLQFQGLLEESQLSDTQKEKLTKKIGLYLKSFRKIHDSISKIEGVVETFRKAAAAVAQVVAQLDENGERMLAANERTLAKAASAVQQRFLTTIIAVALIVSLVLWFAARGIVNGVRRAAEIGSNVAHGDLSNLVESNTNDEVGSLLKTLDRMQTQLRERIERDGRIANEALRIQTALDNVSTSVLVVDKDYRVIYQNQSAQTLFERTEEGIREELPEFSAANLVGSSIDDFHENPDYQKGILDGLTGTHRARIHLGGYVLDLAVNAVINSDGDRIGTALELDDVTEQVKVEQEIDEVVSSVSEGDFERQIDLIGKEGFFNSLGSGVNELIYAVSESIDEVENVMSGLADGNLSHRVSGGMQGAFGRLAGNTNQTIARLFEIVTNIREAATLIASSSSEISNGNENMSQRTEAQAANLEETAATMEEFTSTIRQNADSAQQANQLAADAKESAQKGGGVVDEAIVAMEEITTASDQIASIIGVIDDIAFQTNLLALNASVEAARAGEQGRGFAVVATEVRNLAGRSAQAAKEIKGLIASSSEKVESGTQLVNQSGKNLEEIVHAVQKVNDIISEIAAASREQAMGV
ncbi:MAG: HAMP domain-containing protein, partial [Gammaproteobacteria bacterium]|nr:HAMP domain-containing protein [Gammaproteobacteria bacterium]